ncbi:MAG: YMGG-like glycine zipper-containing protein [Gemmatimonas sp.]
MTTTKKNLAGACALLMLATTASGCSNLNQQQERALSGGAIGAGAGALIGAVSGSWVVGAIVGGAAGAAVGAFTTPSQVHVGR